MFDGRLLLRVVVLTVAGAAGPAEAVAIVVGAVEAVTIVVGAVEAVTGVGGCGILHSPTPRAEFHAEEAVLGLQDVIELGCWNDTQELVVVGLLYLLQLEVNLVMLADGLGTAFLVGRLLEAKLALTLVDGALFLLHLPEKGEEAGSLLIGEVSSLSDELLLLCVELRRVELLSLGMGYDGE